MDMRDYYYKPIVNEAEYVDDLKLFQRLIKNINRYRNRTPIDKQLIVNQLIELFNMFQHEATIQYLMRLVVSEHRPAIKALLRSICQREVDFEIDGVMFSQIPTDYEFLKVIEEESQALGIRRGNIC